MRLAQTQSIGEVFKSFPSEKSESDKTFPIKQEKPIMTKQQLWEYFCSQFYKMYGKSFIKNDDTLENLKVLFYYFLNDPEFFKANNLVTNLNKPDFNKGLLIIGGVGVGKTDYLNCFEAIFKPISSLRFKSYSAKHLVREYEKCASPMDKDYFFKDINRKRIFIDDIGSEKDASNYGLFDVVGEILFDRYSNKQKTFTTTNFVNTNYSVEETLKALGARYGHRIYDRLYEMFNIVTFTGQSLRE
ncbi:MAG: hypothetical protein CMC55_08090 [Flavobacteriaceae bacterium]|uniref:hypothetical protein n=1 Tax=Bizionia echini TaxID=649333 RepID=UPI000C8D53A6|nr:hypothetical protein [Flavobacteriaceae bacterium]